MGRFEDVSKWLAPLYIAPIFSALGLLALWRLHGKLKNLGEPQAAHSKQALRLAQIVTALDMILFLAPWLLAAFGFFIEIPASLAALMFWAPRMFSLAILVLVFAGRDVRILVRGAKE